MPAGYKDELHVPTGTNGFGSTDRAGACKNKKNKKINNLLPKKG